MNKKVLIITDSFPPVGGPGSKRITQFTKYLPEYGWTPIILTHKEYSFMGYDENSLKSVPAGTDIYRTKTFETHFRNTQEFTQSTESDNNQDTKKGLATNRLIQALKDTIGAPDSGMLWLPFAVPKALQLFRKYKYDSILATAPQSSTLIIGYIVSKLTRRPLVLDFRDAWVNNPEIRMNTKIRRFLHHYYEKICIKQAKHVIPNIEGVHDDFLRRYPKEDKSKFMVIPNGYDLSDQVNIQKSNIKLNKDKLNFVHTGSLWSIRNPRNFLKAMGQLIKEEKIDRNDITIHFVGLLSDFDDGSTVEEQIEEYQINDIMNLTGFVNRYEAFMYNAAADILLLIIGITDQKFLATYGLSGKAYDYILTGKPILTLAQKGGATYNLIHRNKIGLIADPLDVEDIKEKILSVYADWKNKKLNPNYQTSQLSYYDIKNLTGVLSKLL